MVGKWLVCTLSPDCIMDFYQTCTSILLRHAKELIDFGDLDPIFEITGGLTLLENGLSAPYLQNEWVEFD